MKPEKSGMVHKRETKQARAAKKAVRLDFEEMAEDSSICSLIHSPLGIPSLMSLVKKNNGGSQTEAQP